MASIKRPLSTSRKSPAAVGVVNAPARRYYLQSPGSWYHAYRNSAGNSIRVGAYAFVQTTCYAMRKFLPVMLCFQE
jgi:hypothetical protein